MLELDAVEVDLYDATSVKIMSRVAKKYSALSSSNVIGGFNFSTFPYFPSVDMMTFSSLNLNEIHAENFSILDKNIPKFSRISEIVAEVFRKFS